MQENTLSPFFSHVVDLCKTTVEADFGLEILTDDCLSSALDETLSANEILNRLHNLCGAKALFQFEKMLIDAFPPSDFIELGLTRTYPRMYRGLPRLCDRNHPSLSLLKKGFTHLPTLKKQAVAKALFSRYSHFIPKGKVVVFTVLKMGRSDNYYTALETMLLLQGRFINLDVQLLALTPTEIEKGLYGTVCYDNSLSELPADVLALLKSADLVVQMSANPSNLQLPNMVTVETGGFSGTNYAMGLHFLEKGIISRKLNKASWNEIKNVELLKWRIPDHHFYLADLSSSMGLAVYLHALLKSLENDEKGIDLCVSDLDPVIKYIEMQKQSGKPILEWDLAIGSIEICLNDRICFIPIMEGGKKVRIFPAHRLIHSDFQTLLSLSGDFVAVSSIQSLTEVLSLEKPFFFDGDESIHYFLKDLLALAESRIGDCQHSLDCIRGMCQAFLYHLPPIIDEQWVDDTFFQERVEWTSIALGIGLSLQEADVVNGFKKLSQIISAEFSCNNFLCNLVQRSFCHLQFPEMAQLENEALSQFTKGTLSFSSLIKKTT